MNSFWPDWWDKWYFDLPYDLVFTEWFYSINAVVDVDNSSKFDDSIEKQRVKEAVRNMKKIYENTKNPLTKAKVAEFATRARKTYDFTDAEL